ncbi:MAG TPA: PfkB family carbohydrate kinase [Phycisphaerae bacterium]|nr:PfkB family carbohydrate kinase [Phycisphaerae bacterium]HNU46917.1 PfkB family carbohydrate kinase [Phycisphaerae bacterium]
MALLITGSIGIDTVTTPHGRATDVLGGCASYSAYAAAWFTPVRLVGVVGEDFPAEFRAILDEREIDLRGVEVRRGSHTFRWVARFEGDMNVAETLPETKLNVLAEEAPRVPATFADSRTVFLANTHPTLQRELLSQLRGPQLVVCDTMNLWIETQRESLLETLRLTTGAIINDGEARQLTGKVNLIEAGEAVLTLGPRFVIIKKGEHGALLVTPDGADALPAFPAKVVRDPTGAGDSFGGAVMGYLHAQGRADRDTLRRAIVRGTVTASFTIEDFSLARLRRLSRAEFDQRVEQYVRMLRIE